MKLTTHLYVAPRLIMSEAIDLLPLYSLMTWIGANLFYHGARGGLSLRLYFVHLEWSPCSTDFKLWHYWDTKGKEDEAERTCSTHEGNRKCILYFSREA